MSSGTRQVSDERALARLKQFYAEMPALSCLGLCEQSCHQHIDAPGAERRRLFEHGVDLDAPTVDEACPALTQTFGRGRYSMHAIRPAQAMRWMLTSYYLGGHGDTSPEVRRLLEQCLNPVG